MPTRWNFLLAAVLVVVAGCGSDRGPDDNSIEVRIRARVLVCAPEPMPEGPGRDCTDLPLPLVPVAIVSEGDTIWTGETGNEGDVDVTLQSVGEFTISVAGEPWIPETLTSDTLTPDRSGQPLTVYVYSEGLYVLGSLAEAP